MRIDLRELDGVLLTVDRNVERRDRIRPFLEHEGFTKIRWIFGKPTKNHHVGAHLMAVDTLKSIRCPALWIEDDAEPIGFNPII